MLCCSVWQTIGLCCFEACGEPEWCVDAWGESDASICVVLKLRDKPDVYVV